MPDQLTLFSRSPDASSAVRKSATLGHRDGVPAYRYDLTRLWEAPDSDDPGFVNFIMLNPSTADATKDDPTIRRCIAYARRWGYDGVVVTNLFALRATDPKALLRDPDPIGLENDAHLSHWAARAELVVCAWGSHAMAARRAAAVLDLLRSAGATPHALKLTGSGMPGHPLYLKADASPFPFVPAGPGSDVPGAGSGP
jgi:hypothetical protein